MSWKAIYKKVLPYVFEIRTPHGSGTGFLFAYNDSKSIVAVATAAHVIAEAHDWQTPIRLIHHVSKKEIFLSADGRYVALDRQRDSASIMFRNNSDFEFPKEVLPMLEATKYYGVGTEIAWVGYPGIVSPQLCFFTGYVSAVNTKEDSYLIDGVAIHGVSGGPVFTRLRDEPELIGSVTSYIPNRIRGDALPGLCSVQDITPFHETVKFMRSLDEAQKRQAEEREKERQKKETAATPAGGDAGEHSGATVPESG